uniref:Uncharacterized protein n=1 Tax=Candidatus Methanogaster sp. ANME-2c ERB4 TaxID=2759911 RepID=A0A7G9YAN8_9EURY|nr:hypothetical protein MGFAJANB_00002 [Methanosarcinales archaeon ANME-2c ERB4]QNO50354.1 hypothetical protein DDJHKDJF_00002 [Methanosarcinales archaeon ANME-2c ERB4]
MIDRILECIQIPFACLLPTVKLHLIKDVRIRDRHQHPGLRNTVHIKHEIDVRRQSTSPSSNLRALVSDILHGFDGIPIPLLEHKRLQFLDPDLV